MMTNKEFLTILSISFKTFLETHPRSNAKLKISHGAISKNLSARLGEFYLIKSLGYSKGKEGKINGRYIDKMVDISIIKDNKPVAGIGVKFVMNNYTQNSNNYFENMLGETANIRCVNIPYFQIVIIPNKMPYYKENGKIAKWETFTQHNIEKYITLSKDNIETFVHSPTKTLLYIIEFPPIDEHKIKNRQEYKSFFLNLDNIRVTAVNNTNLFEKNIVINDFEQFAEKIVCYIKSI